MYKGKGIPITGHEGPLAMHIQGSTNSQPQHWEEVGRLVVRSAAFTPLIIIINNNNNNNTVTKGRRSNHWAKKPATNYWCNKHMQIH